VGSYSTHSDHLAISDGFPIHYPVDASHKGYGSTKGDEMTAALAFSKKSEKRNMKKTSVMIVCLWAKI
jgi:hypothetical protein